MISKEHYFLAMYMKIAKSLLCLSLLLISGCSKDSWWGETKKIDIVGERIPISKTDKDLLVDNTIPERGFSLGPLKNNPAWTQSSGILNTVPSNIEWKAKVKTPQTQFLKDGSEPLLFKEAREYYDMDNGAIAISTFNVTGNNSFNIGAAPIIENNVLYAMGNDGIITAYNIDSGATIWQNKYFNELEKKSLFDFFDSYFITGSISIDNGIIYATAGTGEVLALDVNTSQNIWVSKLSSPSRSAPLIVHNKVIVQTIDNKVFALDKSSGEILWNHFGVGEEISILSTSAPTTDGKMVIVQYTTGEVFSLDVNNGQELWVESISSPLDSGYSFGSALNVVTSPYIGDDFVFAFGNDGYMVALDSKNGEVSWRKEFGLNKPFWVSKDLIFAVNRNNKLIAIVKKTGAVKWIVDLKSSQPSASFSAPIVANTTVLVVSSEGKMLGFDHTTGEQFTSMDVTSNVTNQPIIVNGDLYLSTSGGTIIRY